MKIEMMPELSVLIVAPEALSRGQVDRIFLGSREASLASRRSLASSMEEADTYLSSDSPVDVIVFVADALTEDRSRFIDKAFTIRHIPCVVVSADKEVISFAGMRGIQHVMHPDHLSLELLSTMLNLAIEHRKMLYSMKKMEDMYHNAEQRFKDVADHFSDWMWEIDRQLNITFSTSSKKKLEEAQRGASFVGCFLADERAHIEDDFRELFEYPQSFRDREYWSQDNYGLKTCWLLSGVPVFDDKGRVTGFRGIGRDVSKEKSSVDQLYHLANNDALTGLYNRARFTDELGRKMRLSDRATSQGSVVLIDIDRFNFLNNTHGYKVCDRILVHVAQLLRGALRSQDVLARFGGDDFAVLMPETTAHAALSRMEGFMQLLEKTPYRFDGKEIGLSASVGISHYPTDGKTADEIISTTLMALREARAEGHGKCAVYNVAKLRDHDINRRMSDLDFLTRCLNDVDKRLVLHFQPILALHRQVGGALPLERYEVLSRLVDDDDAYVPPVRFIDVAEEYGLIDKLDIQVCRKSISLLEAWQREGRHISLSVNISGRTFDNDKAMSEIYRMVSSVQLKPGTLVFEITETFALKDLAKMRRLIADFKKVGVLFALDDCGIGYSSLNYIRELELDYIKIDGSFIRDLHRNADDDAFVKALSDIAKRMNIFTVAEMVEERETLEYLKKLGIDFAQGYFFAMPSPVLSESFADLQDKVLH